MTPPRTPSAAGGFTPTEPNFYHFTQLLTLGAFTALHAKTGSLYLPYPHPMVLRVAAITYTYTQHMHARDKS